ncbi:tryptophan 7-halogenase, partial [Actinocatenispora rupis]|uniref:tryptophan 7-halogenase n=1 Tax=Actinocatenispora rupis TaxID=519421 RepID=UPI0027E59E8A
MVPARPVLRHCPGAAGSAELGATTPVPGPWPYGRAKGRGVMGHVVILGGGTAGRVAANRLRRRLDRDAWHITLVDADDEHVYQPGPLMV